MRLAQLARKLSVKPAEIVQFLSEQSVFIEDAANAKVEDETTRLVISHFAPHLLAEQIEEITQQTDESPEELVIALETDSVVALEEPAAKVEVTVVDVSDESLSADVPVTEELPDVIRAPKIELSGLKVLGKIELPEKKKKEEATVESSEAQQEKEFGRDRRKKQSKRTGRNPITEARDRELRELEEKKRQEEERKKEQRKSNYLKQRESKTPTKKSKPVEVKPKTIVVKKHKEEPTSWLGRFMRWLTSDQ